MLDKMFQRNTSKFEIFPSLYSRNKKKPLGFFVFSQKKNMKRFARLFHEASLTSYL